jgi:type I restriction enzyme M protein
MLRQYAVQPNTLIDIPDSGGVADLANLTSNIEIGNKINRIIGRYAEANELKQVLSYLAPFQQVVAPQATDNS